MFSKVTILTTLSLALSIAAAPAGCELECTTGPAYCCNSIADSQSAAGSKILATVGLTAQGITGMVGETCSPFTIIGTASGASCAQQPICCDDNKNNGAVVIGCSPIDLAI